MNRKYLYVLLISFLLFPVLSFAQIQIPDSLTVEQAIQLVIQNNPAVQKAGQNVAASEARVEQSRSSSYPAMDGEASYTRLGPIPGIGLPGLGTFELYPANNYNVNLGVRQLLYDFGKRSVSTAAAESNLNIISENVEMVKSNLAYQTVQIFYSILFLQQNINVLDSQIHDLEQHLLVTRKKVQAGTSIEFNVLTTQVRVALAKNNRMDVLNLLQKQQILLCQLLGAPDNNPVGLKGNFSELPVALSTDSLISLGLSQRPEFKMSRSAEIRAGIEQRLASLGKAPKVNLDVVYGFKNGFIPNLNAFMGNFVAGMSVQVPIFDGYLTKYKTEEAQANVRAAEEQTRETKNLIVSQVHQSISDVRISQEKLQNSQLQITQAEEALAMAKKQYEIGVVSNLDMIDSETTLAEARLIHLRALYNFVLSQYSLDRSIGKKIW